MLSRVLKAKFAAAVRRMMRPVVRQMIAYGIAYPAFEQMVKDLFVEVAERDFLLPFKRQTDSRLAVITGISRKEIAQLRREPPAADEPPEIEDTVATHVIGRWMAGPPYATPDGVPRRLPYEGGSADAPSFSRLVRELGVDIPVRSVLDELIRIGAVELQPDGAVVLRQEGHISLTDVDGKLALIATDPAEVFSTIVHNIESPENPWLQRKVVYDNIGSEALAQLEEEARRLGEEFLRRANALLSSYDRDRNPGGAGGRRSRVVLGTYYFEEHERAGQPPTQTEGKTAPPGRIRRSQRR
jgi:hypothetical protein